MSDGLKAQHRAAIIAALAANDRVERAVLFGSRAMGTNTITSDVDIALFGDRLTLADQAHLAATCDDLPMAQSVDLVLHNTIDNPALVDHIRTHGVEWYRRGGGEDSIVGGGLGDIAEIVMGQSPPGKSCNEWGKGIPLLNGPTEFGSYHPTPVQFTTDARKVAMTGDILFCVRGSTTGRMNYADQQYAIGRGIAAIRHKTNSQLQPLIRGIIETQLSSLLQAATGSTFPNVSANQLSNLIIPKITERQMLNIADLLKSFDDKIELNRRMNETLEAMARAIFKDWFVDFGPVRAKVEGREAYLPEDVWGLFPDSFQESELGEIPRGWGVCSIGSLLTLERKSLIPGDTPQETFSHYSIPAFDNEMLPAQEMGGNIKSSKYIVSKGTFLVSKLNPKTSRVWLPSASKILKQICSTEFLVCRPSFSVGVPFSYLLAKSNSVVQRMGDLASGTSNSHQRIQLADFISLPIIRCNEKLLTFFNASISPLLQKSLETRKENSLLKKCRDILLPKLLSGEIRIQDIGFLIKGERS